MAKEIILDIGHGSDTFDRTGGKGVIVNGKKHEEHDFNSRVAVELDKLLRAVGFKVTMYQKPYSPEIGLNQRINFYNAVKPDLVWSIHANANSNDEVDGCCAFYWHSNSTMRKMALEFGRQVRAAGYHTHGDGTHASTLGSWTNLAITRATTSDAVLTENGFMTNNEPGVNDDFELLFGSKKEEYARDIAKIHFSTICKHFGVNYTDDIVEQVSRPSKPAPKPASGKTESIVDYLNARNMDASFSSRAKLATQYGINGYKGTAEQNTLLLDRIRSGWKPAAKPSAVKTESIVDYLNRRDEDSSFSARAKLAAQYGIKGYKGTAAQNVQLLEKLQQGKAPKPEKPKEEVKVAETKTNEPSDWAKDDWEEMQVNGYLDGTRPHDQMTRQEYAVATNRLRTNLLELINDEEARKARLEKLKK